MSIARSARKAADHIAKHDPGEDRESESWVKEHHRGERESAWLANARNGTGPSVFAGAGDYVVDDAMIDELQARLKRLRGEDIIRTRVTLYVCAFTDVINV